MFAIFQEKTGAYNDLENLMTEEDETLKEAEDEIRKLVFLVDELLLIFILGNTILKRRQIFLFFSKQAHANLILIIGLDRRSN